MGKPTGDEKILSYNDVVLRNSDLDILGGPFFLNDRIIEFYLSYLSSNHPSEEILLTPPSITFWIMNCPFTDSLNDFLQPLDLLNKKLVIFPVNDNEDVSQAEGGNHWSLLAFYRDANVFVHHDSCNGINKRHAERLYRAINRFINSSNPTSDANYVECSESPQQSNGYDCGLYVTAIARTLCSWYEHNKGLHGDGDGLWYSAVKEQASSSFVANMRRDISDLIRSLMALKEYQPATR